MVEKFDFLDNEYPFSGIKEQRRIARAILLDENDNICLEKIDDNDMFGLRDYYETPGGGVKDGEELKDALYREIIEEVGWTSKILEPIAEVHDFYNLIGRENFNYYFFAKRDKFVGQKLEPDEKIRMSKIVWVSIDEAIRLYENMQDELVGKLVKQRELPVLKLVKIALQSKSK